MQAFLAHAGARGLPIKWFGGERPVGFTSAPRHWRFRGDDAPLDRTHAILSNLCDIRTPVSMTDEECDLAAAIVRESLETVISAAVGTRQPERLGID
jgi:hypothetical protein